MSKIHPTAVIEEGAILGENVEVGPYSVVSQHVTLEDGVVVKAHVFLDGHTRVGKGTVIWPGAVIGTKTQDLKYRGETTFVEIGPACDIRECVTINASCGEGTFVRVGERCLIMAYCHIAHNSILGNGVIMSNNATLAGHVTVEDAAIIGGLSAVHQFARIGRHAMVGGMSRVTHDVPPYTIGAGSPYRLGGLNLVGLRRHGFSLQSRIALTKAFRILYRCGLPLQEALRKTEEEVERTPEVQFWLDFCRSSKRGLIQDAGKGSKAEMRDE
jgi:UDP-N-acetylglucosamine acyltransferase